MFVLHDVNIIWLLDRGQFFLYGSLFKIKIGVKLVEIAHFEWNQQNNDKFLCYIFDAKFVDIFVS